MNLLRGHILQNMFQSAMEWGASTAALEVAREVSKLAVDASVGAPMEYAPTSPEWRAARQAAEEAGEYEYSGYNGGL